MPTNDYLTSKTFIIPLLAAGALAACGALPTSEELGAATQDVRRLIDPAEEPKVLLDEDEFARLKALQSISYANPSLTSPVSPDGRTVQVLSTAQGSGFMDTRSGAWTSIGAELAAYVPQTQSAWCDEDTLCFIGTTGADGPQRLVSVSRATGQVAAREVSLPGYPLSLSPNGAYALVSIDEASGGEAARAGSPFDLRVRRSLGASRRAGALTGSLERSFTALSDLELTSGGTRLELVVLATSERTLVRVLPAGSAASPSWSPDGRNLAIVRMTVPTAEAALLSDIATQDALGRLAPKKNPFLAANAVDLFDVASKELRPDVIRAVDAPEGLITSVTFSPDGTRLLAQVDLASQPKGREHPSHIVPRAQALRLYSLAGEPVGLGRYDLRHLFMRSTFFLSEDTVVMTAIDRMNIRLVQLELGTGTLTPYPMPDGSVWQAAAGRDGDVVFSFDSITSPPELYRLGPGMSTPMRLTTENVVAGAVNQVRVDRISFTLSSGAVREGLLVQPADAEFPPRQVPIVMWQNGGPYSGMVNSWWTQVEGSYNLLPNFGIAVALVPQPGRYGYGPEFLEALADDANFGQIDIEEQAEVVQQLIGSGFTAPGLVGISGCSYGGYFSSQSVSTQGPIYGAADAQCSLLDLFNEFQFGQTPFVAYLEGRTPMEDGAEYVKDSPLYQSSRVKTPTLLFHGTEDFLPYHLAENFHDQITQNDTRAQLLLFKDEPHGLYHPNSQLVAGQAQLRWFRRHLRPHKPEAP